MLKFNIKEHKLEELEKYGFTYKSWNQHEYGMEYYTGFTVHISVHSDFSFSVLTIKGEDILYDLIKDGLIIKE